MQLDYHIERSEPALNNLLKLVHERVREGVLEAIYELNYTTDDLSFLTLEVEGYCMTVRTEYERLRRFSKDFNSLFATDFNKVFVLIDVLFNRMRSTMKRYVKLHKKFCKTIRRKGPVKDGQLFHPSYERYSLLASPLYYEDPLTDQLEIEAVDSLCGAIENFYDLFAKSCRLCKRVIRQERAILKDPEKLRQIYENQYNKIAVQHRKSIESFTLMIKEKEAEATRMLEKSTRSFQQFLRDEFHQHNISEMTSFVILSESNKSEAHQNLVRAQHMFGNDNDRIKHIFYIIKNFDKFVKLTKKATKLPADLLAVFMLWCFDEKNTDRMCPTFIKMFSQLYEGCYAVPKPESVSPKVKELAGSYKDKYTTFLISLKACCKKAQEQPEFDIAS